MAATLPGEYRQEESVPACEGCGYRNPTDILSGWLYPVPLPGCQPQAASTALPGHPDALQGAEVSAAKHDQDTGGIDRINHNNTGETERKCFHGFSQGECYGK